MSEEDRMTDKEAYELLLKYSGEKEIVLIKEMIHVAGIDKAVENTIWAYEKLHFKVGQDFKDWMRQAFTYIVETTKAAN
jgi:hypothetical protein